MRAYVSGLIVALALIASNPAQAVTCWDKRWATCCTYQADGPYWTSYYDSCTGQWTSYQYYNWTYKSAVGTVDPVNNHECTGTDYAAGAQYYGTWSCEVHYNPHECAPPQMAETDQWMVAYNDYTGDYSFDQCSGYNGNYRPIAAINGYRMGRGIYNGNGVYEPAGYAVMATGAPNWLARETQKCEKWNYVWSGAHYDYKTDNFIAGNCAAYGANYMGPGPTLLQYAYDGGANRGLYLCQYVTYTYGQGGSWWEYRIQENCNGGNWIEWLGYAKVNNDPVPGQSQSGQLGDNGECSAANCVGMCGVDCNGILGVKTYTNECMAHDLCVCNHGNNIWAWDCLGDFALAAVSFVVAVVETVIQAIINAISRAINAVLDFLFGWL